MAHTKIICRTHLGRDVPWEQARPAIEARMLAKIEKLPSDGCWEWRGYVSPRGRGYMTVQARPWIISRLAYTVWVGPIPEGMYVCHRCDNPICVRPDHLFVGDQEDNLHDMCAKGRHWRATATACRAGHPYEPGTYSVTKRGKRQCKVCQRIRLRIQAGWPRELAETLPVTPHGYRPVNGKHRPRRASPMKSVRQER